MAANYAIPGSLEPPSYGEMARIGALQGEVEHRALSQLRREIGLRNMQRETLEGVQAGMDPMLARRNALFNNARFLFGDNPQALVTLQHNEEANAVRRAHEQALLQYRLLHMDELKRRDDLLSARDEALAKSREDANQLKAAGILSRGEHDTLLGQLKLQEQQIGVLRTQLEGERAAETKRHNLVAETQGAEAKAASDKLLQDWEKKLSTARTELENLQGGPSTIQKYGPMLATATHAPPELLTALGMTPKAWRQSLDRKQKEVTDLEKRVAERRSRLVGGQPAVAAPAPTAAPALKPNDVVVQNGKRYIFKGGSASDPANFVEAP